LIAEIYEDGVLWITKAIGEHGEIKLIDEAPMNLLTFLTQNRDLLQEPDQDEREPQAEQK
jgi:hypothetical protein